MIVDFKFNNVKKIFRYINFIPILGHGLDRLNKDKYKSSRLSDEFEICLDKPLGPNAGRLEDGVGPLPPSLSSTAVRFA